MAGAGLVAVDTFFATVSTLRRCEKTPTLLIPSSLQLSKILLLIGDFSPLVLCSTLTFQGIVKPRNYQFSDLIEYVPAEAAFEKVSGARNNFKPRLAIARHFQCPIHVQRVINETKKVGGAMNQENRNIPHLRRVIDRGDGAVVLGVFIGGRSAGAHAVRIVSRGEFLFLNAFEVIRRGARGYNASHSLVSRCRSHESCHPAAGVAKNSDPSRIDVRKAFEMGNAISRILNVCEVVANGDSSITDRQDGVAVFELKA